MRKILRDRKSSLTSKSKPVVSAPAPLAATEPATPLYARFTTTQHAQDGQNRPVVSGPSHLSSKTSFSRGSNVSSGKGSGQEGHSRVLSRKSSRQDQVQSTPKVLSSLPIRSSSRAAHSTANPPNATPSYSQVPEGQQGRAMYVQAAGVEASSSRTQLPARTPGTAASNPSSSQTTFPQMHSYESWQQHGHPTYSQPTTPVASSSHIQLPQLLDKIDSFESSSDLQPSRPLVVRNQDPETSSSTSLSSSVPQKLAPIPGGSSPPPFQPIPQSSSQPSAIRQTEFALHDPVTQPPSFDASDASNQRPNPTSVVTSLQARYPTTTTSSTVASHTPNLQEQQPEIIPPKSPQFQAATFVSDSSPQAQRAAPPSLLATPSITRKRYSPLAAFGLPVSSNASMTPSSSMQGEPAQSELAIIPSPAPNDDLPTPETPPTPETHPLPAIPMSEQTPVGSTASVPLSIPSSHSSRSTPPPTPPRPLSQSFGVPELRDPSPQRPADTAQPVSVDSTDIIRIPEAEPPLIIRPHPATIQLSMAHSRVKEAKQLDLPSGSPSTPPTKGPKFPGNQDNTRTHTQPPEQFYPPMSHNTTSSHHQGPVRGKPRIFSAAAATSEVEGVEPRVVEMIGHASQMTKTAEGYSAYAYGGQQTSTPPPEPMPEPARAPSPQRRKLSKSSKHSSRKAVEAPPAPDNQDRRRLSTLPASQPVEHHSSSRHHSRREPEAATESRTRDQEALFRHGSNADSQSRRKSTSQDGKLQKRSRDGVKILTDKQMEKLNHRKSYHGAAASQDLSPSAQPSRKSYVEEHVSARPASQYQANHRSSQAYAPPLPAPVPQLPSQSPQKPLPSQPQNTHPSQVSPTQWPGQSHKTPTPIQLPTPPEEYAPVQPVQQRHREASPQKVKRISPKNVEDMEVFAGHGHPKSKIESNYPLLPHLSHPALLENLLAHLSYHEWLSLASASKEIRRVLYEDGREQVLARYLQTVGYCTWSWKDPEPLILTVDDLCHYMRGVSIPVHRYAAMAHGWLQRNPTVEPRTMQELTFASRAFTRVVMRLRAQAEAEAAHNARMAVYEPPSPVSIPGSRSRTMSISSQRHPTKWSSQTSLNNSRAPSRAPSPSSQTRGKLPQVYKTFHSPLFRLRRAPLLQVFVPSPEGDWLSDTSVLECEAELKRAGVLHLMRAGDVVWDVAVGDEANIGRLVWDGAYLIDLDYTYLRVGDPPRYLPTLAFPPSYFHRVIRTMGTGNPIVRIDLSPWADQINANLQLLQDKLRMDTPQGGRHTVVRWVHRSSFVIRPPTGTKSIRLPMPHTAGPGPSPTGAWVIDPDWFGTVLVETEGTNEGLEDLQARCRGPVVPRRGQQLSPEQQWFEERRMVFRILRERSRPGEIWIRVVTDKERIIP